MKTATFQPIKALLLCSCLALTFFTCKQQQIEYSAKAMSASLSNYVYAYTSGTITKKAPIRVRFTSAVVKQEQVGDEVSASLINFKPAIKGKAMWEDDHTILFQPEGMLNSGQKYVGVLDVKSLFPAAPADAASFEFEFRAKEQFFNVVIDGLKPGTPQGTQVLTGVITTNDLADEAAIEKMINAKQNGNALNISWTHHNDTKHTFFVEQIRRTDKASNVSVSWNGNEIGVDRKNERKIDIPAIGVFKVIETRVVQNEEQYILINFSDPLKRNQNLSGLVNLSEYSNGRIKKVIDGNSLKLYLRSRVNGERILTLREGIKNDQGKALAEDLTYTMSFSSLKPQLKIVGSGTIMPNSDGLIFPFEAVGLNAVEVEVFKIYDNNILQFLQTNKFNQSNSLEQVGKIVMQKRLQLSDLNPEATSMDWSRYAVDLSTLINTDPKAIYQIRLGFRPEYMEYQCNNQSSASNEDSNLAIIPQMDEDETFKTIWEYYGVNGRYEGFRWGHRDNPCFPAYANSDNFVRRNVLVSNLGITAKGGNDGSMFVVVNDLRSSDGLTGVKLEFYDYQKQLIQTETTGAEGICFANLKGKKPFFIVAENREEKGYLRLEDSRALSLSRYNVSGTVAQKGMKGYLYGERGVWRPGDTLFLNFVLEDIENRLPENYPLSFELFDPKGQSKYQRTSTENVNNVYPFKIATSSDDLTGSWRAVIKAGGATFTKYLKIETIKPNRLKLDLDFGKEALYASNADLKGNLQVNWLHGAPAQNLKAKVEVQLKATTTVFDKYREYVFDDPSRKMKATAQTIFESTLDDKGFALVDANLKSNESAPGKLKANFKVRAFEKGGDFSTDNFSMDYFPFDAYAGVFVPKDSRQEKRLKIDEEGKIDFISLDSNGKPIAGKTLDVSLYRVNWRWWWDNDRDDISRYINSSTRSSIKETKLKTSGGGETSWNLTVNSWGRYFVRVCDETTGHCSGDFFYAGYPWYGRDDDGSNREAAAMLTFEADKEKYAVGEQVELNIPSGGIGKILVSIETGSKVLKTFWKDAKPGETKITFDATPEMAPTAYAHVSLIQPHAQVKNDLPIRLYGVAPVKIEDMETRLNPTITMNDELQPESDVQIEVAEKDGKAMAYTIAVVDDGLLDLTRFKTPNPWDIFYAREALGVKTWDVYNQVMGAYGGELERILSIGGDAANPKAASEKANRFKPVVMHLGPFYLEAGQKAKHAVRMPNYVGSVRTMVVASNNGAYGNAEKTTPVKKPLMVLATLPRVLGPKEQLTLPVNVFAMDKKIKNVTVKLEETSGLVKIKGDKTKTLTFTSEGEKMVNFDIEVNENIGVGRFKITASGHGETASQEIEIQIRNPNPYVTDVHREIVEAGEGWEQRFDAVGMYGTNEGVLEVSNIPPLNLGERMNYLIRYPHGCIEQTTSSGFPQLYVGKLMDLPDDQKKEIPVNVQATVDRLTKFQLGSGGFTYWPGNEYSTWGTNYAGHFILEAKAMGYDIPVGMVDRWVKFQTKKAQQWQPNVRDNDRYYYGRNDQLMQAYRLYGLALAGKPELGAMNRMRELKDLQPSSKWRLAGAYAKAGKPEISRQIIQGLEVDVEDYRELSFSYGSRLRDQGMILETLTDMGDTKAAAELTKDISELLSSDQWYNTHALAYSLLAIGKFVGGNKTSDKFEFAYQIGNGSMQAVSSDKPVMQIKVPVDGNNNRSIALQNKGGGIIYGRLILSGQPLLGDQTEVSNNLSMSVKYKTMTGEALDPISIPQGTDFIAEVVITNPGKKAINYDEMALSQIFPSGWEIHNFRMDNIKTYSDSTEPEYRDIRDDRVYTYFDIQKNQSHTYRVQLNAAYQGTYYLPTTYCEAMYDNTINARKPGKWVDVVDASSTLR